MSKDTKTCTFLCNKKSRSTSGFSYFGMKKATALCGRSPMLIVVQLTLGAGLDLLDHLGNKLVNAHLNGLV